MALEKEKRLLLQKFVSAGRKLLSTEYSRVLEGVYGLNESSGQVEDIDSLTFSSDQEYEAAKVLRARFVLYGDSVSNSKEVVNRLVRELSFTTLNRFVALKIFEKRGIILESVSKGYNSKGFQLYKRVCDTSLGESYFAFKSYLMSLFDELTDDLNTVFDRYSEFGVLFPREAILNELLELINDEHLEDIWNNDEALGWIYQYFNLDSERKKMRDQSKNPRSSRELAVRNQFFTPRYVVESLVDNTLAKYWVECNSGNSELKSFCKYLLVDESEPVESKAKDPRELKILDPACGSMHFGLYVFDLLEKIYEEAWELELTHGTDYFERKESEKSLTQSYNDREEFYRHIPKLIVENNINGVDIDPRAAQIAQLAIWLRAQKSWNDLAVSYADRPKILKNFIVTAESFSNSEKLLERFESTLGDIMPTYMPTYKEIKDELTLANMLGSLVRFNTLGEESLKDVVKALKTKVEIFNKPEDVSFLDFHNFKDSMNKALQFLSVLVNKYDAILMNPPFGEAAKPTLSYLKSNYNEWNKNILCCFFEKTYDMLTEVGSVGAIYDRTALVKSTYEGFRKTHLIPNNRISVLIDLGWEVLDANVEVTSVVLSRKKEKGYFIDLRDSKNKENDLLSIISYSAQEITREESQNFLKFPNSVIGYDFPRFITRAFTDFSSLKDSGLISYTGTQLKSDRHYRNWWEITDNNDYFNSRLYNGSTFSPYFTNLLTSVASPVHPFNLPIDSSTVIRNKSLHWQGCTVAFGKRGEHYSAQVIKDECLFTTEGQAFKCSSGEVVPLVLFLNTPIVRYMLNRYCGQHKVSGYVNLLPYCRFDEQSEIINSYEDLEKKINLLVMHDLLSPEFKPQYESYENLDEYSKFLENLAITYLEESNNLENICQRKLEKLYRVSDKEKVLINKFKDTQPEVKIPITDLKLDQLRKYVSISVIHYLIEKCFVEKNTDILTNFGKANSLNTYIKDNLSLVFKNDPQLETSILGLFNVDSVEALLDQSSNFFRIHLKLYTKNRRVSPIFWPLSVCNSEYVFWLNYRRLSDGSILNLINDHVSPLLVTLKKNLESLSDSPEEKTAVMDKILEIEQFKNKLIEVSKDWSFDCLDGPQVIASTLRDFFEENSWKELLQDTWSKLENGDLDWSTIAFKFFRTRVMGKIETDEVIKTFQEINLRD